MSRRIPVALACLAAGALAGTVALSPLLHSQQAPQAAPALPREITSYRDVVKAVLPAVVSIDAKAKPKPRNQPAARPPQFDDERVPEEMRKFFDDFHRRIPEMPDVPQQGFGSGFLIDAKGVILTNYHVVDGADQVEVTLHDGRKFTSKDFKADPKTDLAIVRIESKEPLPFLELGDSAAMEIGDRVLAVGAPFGLAGSVTHGIVSGKGRSLRLNLYEDFLQTDAAINPGNSGGPLVSLEGKVIGINSAIKSRSGGFQGVGLAVASNLAKNVVSQLLKDGVVHRGYLGVQIKDLGDPEVAARLGLTERGGVLVTQVFDGAPGAKGGVQDGDVIVSIAGKPVRDGRELQGVVAGLALNVPAEVVVLRDGQRKALQVTVEEQPKDFGNVRVPLPRAPERGKDAVNLEAIGAEVSDLTAEAAEQMGYKSGAKGAVITQVERDGLAAEAGLRRGMLVTRADRQPVTTAAELRDALASASLEKGVLLQVQSPQGGTNFVLLKKGGQ